MCNFVRVPPHYGIFFTAKWWEKYLWNSYSVTTYKVQIVRVLKSLHISPTDHWFLRMLEICVKRACSLHMLNVNRKMCTRNQMKDCLRSILHCACFSSWTISGFRRVENGPATKCLCGEKIPAELTQTHSVTVKANAHILMLSMLPAE